MQPIIKIENLFKTYSTGFEALKGVNLEIRRGEILALLGPNGSGKSTVVNTISGLLSAKAGDIRFEGASLVGRPPPALPGVPNRTSRLNRACNRSDRPCTPDAPAYR